MLSHDLNLNASKHGYSWLGVFHFPRCRTIANFCTNMSLARESTITFICCGKVRVSKDTMYLHLRQGNFDELQYMLTHFTQKAP